MSQEGTLSNMSDSNSEDEMDTGKKIVVCFVLVLVIFKYGKIR